MCITEEEESGGGAAVPRLDPNWVRLGGFGGLGQGWSVCDWERYTDRLRGTKEKENEEEK